jgi:hypothetical protein
MICKLAFSSTLFSKFFLSASLIFSVSFDILLFNFLDKGGACSYTHPTKEQASISIVTDCVRETLSPVICNKHIDLYGFINSDLGFIVRLCA